MNLTKQEALKNVEELKQKTEELEQYIKGLDKKSIFNLERGDGYYYLNEEGEIDYSCFNNDSLDKNRISKGNAFLTEKEAEKERDKRQSITNIKKYIFENDLEFEPDLEDKNQNKYYIEYDNRDKEFLINNHNFINPFTILPYFKSIEDAKQVIENCKEDLEKLR